MASGLSTGAGDTARSFGHGPLPQQLAAGQQTERLERQVINRCSLLYRWQGTTPDLSPVLLMAHQDVVAEQPTPATLLRSATHLPLYPCADQSRGPPAHPRDQRADQHRQPGPDGPVLRPLAAGPGNADGRNRRAGADLTTMPWHAIITHAVTRLWMGHPVAAPQAGRRGWGPRLQSGSSQSPYP